MEKLVGSILKVQAENQPHAHHLLSLDSYTLSMAVDGLSAICATDSIMSVKTSV